MYQKSIQTISICSSYTPGSGANITGLTANVLIENSECRCGNGVRVMPGIGAPRNGRIVNVTYRNIKSINTSSGIRIAALAYQRGSVENITFDGESK